METATSDNRGLSGTEMNTQPAVRSHERRFGAQHANPSHKGGGALRLRCPHCLSLAKVRTTREVTALYRELRFQCTNVEGDEPCGHTFVASMVIERTIVPSAKPNPRINLPIASPRIRRVPSDHPASAND